MITLIISLLDKLNLQMDSFKNVMLGVGECLSVAPMLSVIMYVQVEGMGIILGLLASQFTNQLP